MQYVLLFIIKIVTRFIALLPYKFAEVVLAGIIEFLTLFSPKIKRVAIRNLEIAFPEIAPEERVRIYKKSLRSLARVLVDFCRLPGLTKEWVEAHIECPFLERFRAIKANHTSGLVIATGHLGSFELLASCLPFMDQALSFVVRPFDLKVIDEWWTASRERNGNKVISRKGAFREMTRTLAEGRDVALLFDQNVTRNHAVFVDWFGKPAATTRAVALAALKFEVPIIVTSMLDLPDGRYRIHAVECDCQDIMRSDLLSQEDKIFQITGRISAEYEKMIRLQPENWFWVHRRWRTRPEGEHENPYAGC